MVRSLPRILSWLLFVRMRLARLTKPFWIFWSAIASFRTAGPESTHFLTGRWGGLSTTLRRLHPVPLIPWSPLGLARTLMLVRVTATGKEKEV